MNQLTQELKSGNMEILEVPVPVLNTGQILVRNIYSVISAGTEGKTVSDARKGYIAKARSRKKEVAQVIEMVKSQGIKSAYNTVMSKLEAPSPLGYSCAGEVIAVAEGITDLKPGDFVACGGQGAFHAEVVSVYRNLCVKLPEGTDLKHAAFTTVSSIAIQGIRQAEVNIGCNCVVIGLGLIGQITIQILNASGVKSIGIDINPNQVKAAANCGAAIALLRDHEGLEQIILRATGGLGADAVIITAGTNSLDPVELAGVLCRQKGKVVIVGAVPTGFSRNNYYKKELELKMSSSYGPGRYDPEYEEKGRDYPAAYVRWTENRNMQTFVDLLITGKLDISKIITHEFPLEEAPEAYNMILSENKDYSGILIRYNSESKISNISKLCTGEYKSDKDILPVIGLIGAGNFAQNVLLPVIKGNAKLKGVATAHGNTSVFVGRKYGFRYCTTDYNAIIEDPTINTIFIVTRHNLHSVMTVQALKAGKSVFVEKPLVLKPEELELFKDEYNSIGKKPLLMVGYNRRFAPFIQVLIRKFIVDQPKGINIRVNAGVLPPNHWVHDPETGGGRIIGEACHFIDLAIFLAGSSVVSVSACEVINNTGMHDSFIATLRFRNGSAASISYFSNGNKDITKELIEVFCDGSIARIDDFKTLEFYGKKSFREKKTQDKGHKNGIIAFINSIENGLPSPISFEQLYHSSLVTFKVIESIRTGKTVIIDHSY